MHWLRKILGRYWFLIVIGIMFFLFLCFATGKKELDIYQGGNATYTIESESETQKHIPASTYTNSEVALTLQIPDGWQYVLKDGYDTFIHSASASSIQVQVLSYYPMINIATAESLSESYGSIGYQINEFQKISNNRYCLIYQSQGLSGITDYIENVIWDRDHVVKIVATFNDSNYERLKDEIWYCIDSLNWKYENPIPDDIYMVYQTNGDFEYGVPITWEFGSSSDAFYAYDPTTNATMAVNLIEDPTPIDEVSQIDYANFLSSGKQNFALSKFLTGENNIYAEATYISNGRLISLVQQYHANRSHHYIVTFEYPSDYSEQYVDIIHHALSVIRIFEVPEMSTEPETEAVALPDLPMQPELLDSLETDPATSSYSDTSTLANALLSVIPATLEQTSAIERIWYDLQLGEPTYAEGCKENSTNYILSITNGSNNIFYFVLEKNGWSVKEVRSGSEDGPILYTK